jgi:Protein  of unknown function (DUF3018)
MPRTVSKSQPSKFARYREKKRAEGKKLLRMWVLDPNAPGFAERMKEEADRLAASEDEEEVMRWIEAVTADLDLPPYDWPDDGEPGKGSPG